MNKHLQQTAFFLFFSFVTATAFAQSWTASGGNSNLTPTANAGIGIAASSEAKLNMQSATKYSMYLTNTGITETNPAVTTSTAYGIYTSNSNAIAYGGTVCGIYSTNNLNTSTSGSGYGAYLSVNGTGSTASKTIYGVYSTVSGLTDAARYAGYFTGGKVVIMEGNVGVGYTNPTAKLDVNGIVRATDVKVCLNQGCDYVFEKDYKLMPLKELSTFVKTKKHLPEVAPAAIMESEGINLSEMNALLLKKIEELTLYIIEQNERIENLENMIK